MSTIPGIRTGLATRLATIAGLSAYDVAPGQVVAPAAIVLPGKPVVEFNAANGILAEYRFRIMVLAGQADYGLAQELLDAYLGPTGTSSIKAAIEADGTLGGAADYSWVSGVDEYGAIDYAGVTYLGAIIDVEVQG